MIATSRNTRLRIIGWLCSLALMFTSTVVLFGKDLSHPLKVATWMASGISLTGITIIRRIQSSAERKNGGPAQ